MCSPGTTLTTCFWPEYTPEVGVDDPSMYVGTLPAVPEKQDQKQDQKKNAKKKQKVKEQVVEDPKHFIVFGGSNSDQSIMPEEEVRQYLLETYPGSTVAG